ncbi:UPF0481 protein At3g47200-like [Actinidia eriantha]|uniref:UPF0481 protein At3g47200-like n=1 Tax=Actinidia eriantha TaxID=165200 RepID=UPI002588B2CF|nr:UPF0481 protein At3g47200-like [Actinidia eriantha]
MSEWFVRVEEELKGLQDASSLSTTDLLSMDPVELWEKRCIYKVPASVKDRNKKAYEPQLVSFGPYHHGEEHLMRMEEYKHRALLHFIRRSDKPLALYRERLLEAVQDLKDSYDSLDPSWQSDSDRFLQLMILDGCFMLEFLRCNTDGPPDDYFGNDPIFSSHGELHILSLVRRDMLLLENQLPIMVLHRLVAVETGQEAQEHVHRLVCSFWNVDPVTTLKGLHMLDAVRNFLVGVENSHFRTTRRERTFTNMIDLIGSAMDLSEAGIRFKWIRTGNVNDISFRDGVLSLPLVLVGNSTESSLLNLIAFERLHIGAGTEVTNYVFFLGCILKSERDVGLLESQHIILKTIGSNQDIVEIFKSLSKEISRDHEDKLDEVYEQIIFYRHKRFNRLRASIAHAYHVSTEWSPLAYWSIILAILLLALSVLQTAYTILRYYRPRK